MSPAVNVPSTNTLFWKVATPTYVDTPATCKLPIPALADKNKFFHFWELDPKSYVSFMFGIKLEFTSALNTTLSPMLSPILIVPLVPEENVTSPIKNELPVTDNPPPTVTFLATPNPPSSWTPPVFTSPRVLSVWFEKVVIPDNKDVPVTVRLDPPDNVRSSCNVLVP